MVTEAALWAALEDVKDPEMPPVSVVDMGMVNRVMVQDAVSVTREVDGGTAIAQGSGGRATAAKGAMGGAQVLVEMTPTFVGCPALEIIRRDVAARLNQVAGVAGVEVRFVWDPPWTTDRITEQGRARLRSWGIAPPPCAVGAGGPGREAGQELEAGQSQGAGLWAGLDLVSLEEAPLCPYCGSGDTHMENLFGPTACRSIFYCDGCRQPFEGIKPV